MYFPYLRGRQYELLALRELVEKDLLSEKIIPIIEPVKFSATLIKTIEAYKKNNKAMSLIVNPKVGTFINEINAQKNEKLFMNLKKLMQESETLLFSKILLPGQNAEKFIGKHNGHLMTICDNKDGIPTYEKYFKSEVVNFNLIPDDGVFRRRITENRVMLDDKFHKLPRNSDYIALDDEPFSDDHLYYQADGYVGFSDYSVVGKDYNDTGFAPFAVAIHIVYFGEDNGLRIKHFVSDSNDDITDPAGKFHEAVEKLVQWNKIQRLETAAIKEFEELYKREAYPGLGTVKKLSIMHHIELMGKYLDKESL